MKRDTGLDNLLDLAGEIIVHEDETWIKIEATLLDKPTMERPHGIKYSLTLHDKDGRRVLGFDNAHEARPGKRGSYAGSRVEYDHKHSNDKVNSYQFQSAEQLLSDFFAAVDRFIAERNELR